MGMTEALPRDPIEALRRLEATLGHLGPSHSSIPQTTQASSPAHADPLQTLKDLEKAEPALWALPPDVDEEPSTDTEAEPAPDVASRREQPHVGLPKSSAPPTSAAPGETGRHVAATSSKRSDEKTPAPPKTLPAATGERQAPREFMSAASRRDFEPYLAKNPGGVFPPAPRTSKASRSPTMRPELLEPAQDPGVAARAAFYKARQELGAGASLDEIISRACVGLDRRSQEILFEIQLKLLFSAS
jgi:hypothetical protein